MPTTTRRHFLRSLASLPLARFAAAAPVAALGFATPARAAADSPGTSPYRRLLVIVELKGGNDGLNTLVPYADAAYYALRPKLAIAPQDVVQLSERVGLHPALSPLADFWEARELAVLQGVGYPQPNLSHFRSIEIWDTASKSDEYVRDGWLTRTFAKRPVPSSFAADAVVVGSNDLGPLAGDGARAIALDNPQQFLRRAALAEPTEAAAGPALAHIMKVENDIVQARVHLASTHVFRTEFPAHAFGNAVKAACRVIANPAGVAAVRLSLGSFDTHVNQAGTHARLLGELAQGLTALKRALVELDRWDDTLVVTYSEFGRRPRENQSAGTDHGTAAVQFALGGRVTGGLYGSQPDLRALGSDGNLRHTLDFREVYATVLDRWWGIDPRAALRARFEPVAFLRS
ncbi:MAG: DUF1501 domain-containing protein [Betaproteobacteria bacterium]